MPARPELITRLAGWSWTHQESLAALLFSWPVEAGLQDQLETVALDSGHASWRHALSCRPQLSAGAWQALWALRDPYLEPGLCKRVLQPTQLECIIDTGSDQALAWAIEHNGALLQAGTLAHIVQRGGVAGLALVRAALAGAVSAPGESGTEPADETRASGAAGVAPILALASAAGPVELLRLAAAWHRSCTADQLEQAVLAVTATSLLEPGVDEQFKDLIAALTRAALSLREDVRHRVRAQLDEGRLAPRAHTWLAEQLTDAERTCHTLAALRSTDLGSTDLGSTGSAADVTGADTLAAVMQLNSSQLLALQAGGPLRSARAQALLCRRLHTPSLIARFGALLTGSDRCTLEDCWANSTTSGGAATRVALRTRGRLLAGANPSRTDTAAPVAANVGDLRRALADRQHDLLELLQLPSALGPVRTRRPELAGDEGIGQLLQDACTQLGIHTASWELLCWLIDTVDASTAVSSLTELAHNL